LKRWAAGFFVTFLPSSLANMEPTPPVYIEQRGEGFSQKPQSNDRGWERSDVVTHEQPIASPSGEGQSGSRLSLAGRNSIYYDLHDLTVLWCPGGTPVSVGSRKPDNSMKEVRLLRQESTVNLIVGRQPLRLQMPFEYL